MKARGADCVVLRRKPLVKVYRGQCQEIMRTLRRESVASVVTDPPYPEISRAYGRLTEFEWQRLLRDVVGQCRRVLQPSGSAVFILQPNMERVGRMRSWLWDFMTWTSREWNQVQDAWWWNVSTPPKAPCMRKFGLMRPSVKACVWLGPPDCYRDQDAVLWTPAEEASAKRRADRARRVSQSGLSMRSDRCLKVAEERGGVTPHNILPMSNQVDYHGATDHGSGTPVALASWWTRYITPEGGTVLDPFLGTGSMGEAAIKLNRGFVGIEADSKYFRIAVHRLRILLRTTERK